MPAITCPDRDQLASFVLGTLGEQDAERVGKHLSACAVCAAAADTLDGLEDSVIAGLRESGSESRFEDEPEFAEALGNLRGIGPCVPLAPVLASDTCDLPERLGEFQILGQLGKGGMGVVYRARHLRLGRTVAIKVLPAERVQDPDAKARFDREMLAVGQLEHANIVRAYDGREIDGQTVLVMEYVEGIDLTTLVARLGPLPIPEACELTRQAADGLQFIHERGLVHRDIKPSNLMLACGSGTPVPVLKILDLGLARLYSDGEVASELTSEGRAMGTADYISPEQALNSHDVEIRSDLYSLGCTLYKLLAGHAPFDIPGCRLSAQKLAAHLRDTPTHIRKLRPEVPEGLAAILDRLLAKISADRYDFPEDLAEAIQPFAAGADLAALARRAVSSSHRQKSSSADNNASASTDAFVKSAVSGTDANRVVEARIPVAAGLLSETGAYTQRPSGPAESTPPSINTAGQTQRHGPRRHLASLLAIPAAFWRDPTKPRWLKTSLALLPLPLIVLMGVLIVVRFQDREVAVQLPDDYQAEIDAKNETVTISPRGEKAKAAKPKASHREESSGSTILAPLLGPPGVEEPLRLLWQREITRSFENGIPRVKLSPDGKHLAVFHMTHTPIAPVEKLDAKTGTMVWERTARLTHRVSISGWVDSEENLYLMSCWGGYTFWKFDPEMQQPFWSYKGGEGFEYVMNVITDAEGNVYAAGYTGSFYPRGSRVVKLDASGKPLWEHVNRYGKGTDAYCTLALDSDGNLFRAGRDNINPEHAVENQGRVIGHRAEDGEELLNYSLPESNSNVGGLIVDAEGNICIAYSLNLLTTANETTGKARTTVAKLDRQGNIVWKCELPDEGLVANGQNALSRGPGGRLYVACSERKDRKDYPVVVEIGDDGKSRWIARIDAPGWCYHLSGIEVGNDAIYVGLSNSADLKQSQVLALEVPRAK